MVLPLFVGREKSIKALQSAMDGNKEILLVAQKMASEDEPRPSELYEIGTVASILQLLKLPDGTVKVLIEGGQRASVSAFDLDGDFYRAEAHIIESTPLKEHHQEAMMRVLMDQFDKYVKASKKIPAEVMASLQSIEEPGRLCDTMAAHLTLPLKEKQALLAYSDVKERLEYLVALMESELDLLQVEKRIRGRVKEQMEKSQREYYLNEQMKAIQKEMNDLDETPNEAEAFQAKIDESGMPKEAKEKTEAELQKLKMMSPMSAEATVVRAYLEWMLGCPWTKRSKVRHDLLKARNILEEDHYGLEEVKERILEYLAVQMRVKKSKSPVLCLVGPPGVGKTSLGESIARATNRNFVRMALGGVRDESEIRGHRRTYIGSMPGKIIQKLSKTAVKNPLFLLDEIDKMGMDHRGDPASALLEVLDPEQNHTFNDHYLEVDFDLSEVMFVCTSNSMNMPEPLLDRMEIIRIPGYTEDEKLNIGRKYLVPKQIKHNGLGPSELEMPDETITDVIRYYTKEAGVRGLDREIAKISRKVVRQRIEAGHKKIQKNGETITITPDVLSEYAGVRKYTYGLKETEDRIGQVTGLAWTSVGGELLTIEAVSMPGKGKQIRTGSLGDVMQESIQAAMTVARSRAIALGINPSFHEKTDLHIHVPEGATPKDGPSAGIGMCTALVSVLANVPVKSDVAMTGEITLRGQVLQIGGLKEKLLAAHRGGIKTVIIPDENVPDLKEIPENVKAVLDIKPVKWIDEVLDVALSYIPEPYVVQDVKNSSETEQNLEKNPPTAH
jgi:ATP-dependent Lon protease